MKIIITCGSLAAVDLLHPEEGFLPLGVYVCVCRCECECVGGLTAASSEHKVPTF